MHRHMGRSKGQGTWWPMAPTPTGRKRWRVVATMPDGKRVTRVAYSQAEAERVRGQLVEMRELDLDPTRQTLAVFLRGWIASMDTPNSPLRPNTLDNYRTIIELHIIPALGSLKLSAVTPRRIQAWVWADPYSARTVHHHHAVLRRALNVAVRQRMLPYNPALAVELPKARREVADPLSVDEAIALLEATRDDRLGPLWRLALVTGMREGELLGLAWEDVNVGEPVGGASGRSASPDVSQPVAPSREPSVLLSPSVTVRSQLQRRAGEWHLTDTKAARKVERIAIDPDTASALEAHRRRMTLERQPSWEFYGLVFVTPEGQPYQRKQVLRAFHAACDRAEIKRRRVHDLRHSSLRLLKDAGVAEDVRMSRAGHNTQAMSRKYGGASEAMDRQAALALGRALGGGA